MQEHIVYQDILLDTVCYREHCQNLPEGLSHWAHAENYVQVVPDSLYQVAE